MKPMKPVICLLVLMAILLTACTGTTAPATGGEAEPQQGGITLQLWGFAGEYEFIPALIEEFQADNPGVTVEITDIPEGDYMTKIDTALLAGEPPDLGFVYDSRWMISGAFLDLTASLEQEGINIDDFNAGVMSTCMYEGKVYCIGTYTGAVLMYYNKDVFDAAGVPYPSSTEPMTIDEYAAMIAQLSNHAEDINERIWGGDIGAGYWFMDRLTMFSEDGRQTDGYINDEATTHFYEVLVQIQKDGSVISGAEGALMEGTDLLAQGKLATSIIDNAVAIPTLETATVRYGAAPPPVEMEGDAPYAPTWTDAYGVFAGSEHPEEAMRFLAFLIKRGNELRLEQGNLSLNLTLAEEREYGADIEGRRETLEAINAAAQPMLDVPNFWEVTAPIGDAFVEMVEDGVAPAEALNGIAPIMQESLDQAWETRESLTE